MRIFLILAGLLLPLVAAPQEIYRWVDKDGIVHYSDQPGAPDAVLVTVVAPNAYEADPGNANAQPSYQGPDDSADSPMYDSLRIVQPTPDQVFFNSDATVNVVAELGGELQPEHALMFYVNGSLRTAEDGFGLTLTGLPRGSHFLRAVVFDSNRQALISSPQVTFHVRQASTQNPQTRVPVRPQAPRPTPTPVPAPRPAPTPTPRPIPAPSS